MLMFKYLIDFYQCSMRIAGRVSVLHYYNPNQITKLPFEFQMKDGAGAVHDNEIRGLIK